MHPVLGTQKSNHESSPSAHPVIGVQVAHSLCRRHRHLIVLLLRRPQLPAQRLHLRAAQQGDSIGQPGRLRTLLALELEAGWERDAASVYCRKRAAAQCAARQWLRSRAGPQQGMAGRGRLCEGEGRAPPRTSLRASSPSCLSVASSWLSCAMCASAASTSSCRRRACGQEGKARKRTLLQLAAAQSRPAESCTLPGTAQPRLHRSLWPPLWPPQAWLPVAAKPRCQH